MTRGGGGVFVNVCMTVSLFFPCVCFCLFVLYRQPRLYGPYKKDAGELEPEAVTRTLLIALESKRPRPRRGASVRHIVSLVQSHSFIRSPVQSHSFIRSRDRLEAPFNWRS